MCLLSLPEIPAGLSIGEVMADVKWERARTRTCEDELEHSRTVWNVPGPQFHLSTSSYNDAISVGVFRRAMQLHPDLTLEQEEIKDQVQQELEGLLAVPTSPAR